MIDYKQLPEFDNHKQVVPINDRFGDLIGFIAIHDTTLGPSTGGTRYWFYDSPEKALKEALRLSRAMTYKCALAGVPYGGGKAVIIANSHWPKTKELWEDYTAVVNSLEGTFTTGEDMGIDADDIKAMHALSPYVLGVTCGELAPWTAMGVFLSIQEGLKTIFGSKKINGRSFAVKGLGKVGIALCQKLLEEGGKIIAADINENVCKNIIKTMPGIKIVPVKEIHRQKVDVFSPCANGGDLNDHTISELDCKIVCGGANNQLESVNAGKILLQRGILYIPDYVANAGGLINIVGEREKNGYDPDLVRRKIEDIPQTVASIINLSATLHLPPGEIADNLAREKLQNIENQKK